jgi:hypothetical protein
LAPFCYTIASPTPVRHPEKEEDFATLHEHIKMRAAMEIPAGHKLIEYYSIY